MTRYLSRKKIFQLLVLSIVLFICFIIVFSNRVIETTSFALNFSFFIIIFVSAIQLLKAASRHSYSLELVFWVFNFIFFGLAGYSQYLMEWEPWALKTNDYERLLCNLLIILWIVSFILGKNLKLPRISLITKKKELNSRICFRRFFFSVLFLFSLALSIFLIAKHGFIGLIFRRLREDDIAHNSALSLLIYHGIRNFILYMLVTSMLIKDKSYAYKIVAFSLALSFIVVCFPTGLSRYMAGTYYLGLLILVTGKNRVSIWFSILFMLGITIAFPLLNIFRYISSFSEYSIIDNVKSIFSSMYSSGHYDSHGMIISTMHYVDKYGYLLGFQMVANLLFFIPRSIWPHKPIGSGALVIETLNQFDFSNVSMPLISEFYLNFGLLGVVFGGIVIGIFVRSVDRNYWNCTNKYYPSQTIYPFLVFYFFFIQRGDLLSTLAYTLANFIIGLLICKMVFKKKQSSFF